MGLRLTKDDFGRLVKAYLKGLFVILIVGVPMTGFFYLVDWGFGKAGVDVSPNDWGGQRFLVRYGCWSLLLSVLFYFGCKYAIFKQRRKHKWLWWTIWILWVVVVLVSVKFFGYLVYMAGMVTVGPFTFAFGEYGNVLKARRGTEDTRNVNDGFV